MPSLRQRVSSYFRQLSFHNEPRNDKKHNVNENSFVTKYLQGHMSLRDGPPIIYGKNPTDLPNYELGQYETGSGTVVGCYTGPNGGLTTVKRTEKHLSVLDPDIDFIDTGTGPDQEETEVRSAKKSPQRSNLNSTKIGQPVDNSTMVIKVAGQEYCVTNRTSKTRRHEKSHSLGSISDFDLQIETTRIDREFYSKSGNEKDKDGDTQQARDEKTSDSALLDNNNSVKVSCKNSSSDATTNVRNILTDPKTVDENKSLDGCDDRSKNFENNQKNKDQKIGAKENYSLAKSKSEGNPFRHQNQKRGKIIKVAQRPISSTPRAEDGLSSSGTETGPGAHQTTAVVDDSQLPSEWNRKSNVVYGISDSLYDRNQVTRNKNGDPIADCFGIIARADSAILAVADGVNWGEKASVAAKSAVHGCLHYLNKTIFDDTKPFENLTQKSDPDSAANSPPSEHSSNNSSNKNNDRSSSSSCEAPLSATAPRVANTREIFVCLLRAFNCAHDLILENKGMLTTLTVAVVLPLRPKVRRDPAANDSSERIITQYVCCVCNVGDTLAYVYSQKHGLRELTRGSHDINCNRDMRDALGALGPVDGINPELSNLTLSITTLQKGDIVLVASDGLTDNFDPHVCRFTVNTATVKNDSSPTIRNNIHNRIRHGGGGGRAQQQIGSQGQQGQAGQTAAAATTTTSGAGAYHQQNQSSSEQSSQKISNDSGSGTGAVTVPAPNTNNKQQAPVKPPRRSHANRSTHAHASANAKTGSVGQDKVGDGGGGGGGDTSSVSASSESSASLSQSERDSRAGSVKSDAPADAEINPCFIDDIDPLKAHFIKENSITSISSDSGNNTKKKPPVHHHHHHHHHQPAETKTSSLRRQQQQQISTLPTSVSSQHTESQKKSTAAAAAPSSSSSRTIANIGGGGSSSKTPSGLSKNTSRKSESKTAESASQPVKKPQQNYKFLRSKTTLEVSSSNRSRFMGGGNIGSHNRQILRNEDGIPYVTPLQRYELQLLLIEDVLKNGISGRDSPCTTARKLCENLVNFTFSITSAKRHTLEDHDLYFDNRNGVLVEVSQQEKKLRRKRGLERVGCLPGKLDHVSVVAWNVGNYVQNFSV